MRSAPKKKILVSLPAKLIERLDEFAAASYRDRSAELERRLEESMAGESIGEHGVIVRGLPAGQK